MTDAFLGGLITEPDKKLDQEQKVPVQFMLGEAMVSQKKLKSQGNDLNKIKEVMAELQIYVQKHHVAIQSELVDDLKLKVTIESLRNEMEIRYELALKQFYDKMKVRMEDHVTKEELDERLYEKLHKREFEKHFERLNSTASTLETRVVNAIPAMKYDLETGLKGKADSRELEKMKTEKAGMELVLKLVARINSLEEKVALKGGGARRGSASSSGSSENERSRSRGRS